MVDHRDPISERENFVEILRDQQHCITVLPRSDQTRVDRGHRMAGRVGPLSRADHAVNAAVLISYICNRMEDKFGVVSFAAATENGVAFGRGAVGERLEHAAGRVDAAPVIAL